jgi:hypothetical protein
MTVPAIIMTKPSNPNSSMANHRWLCSIIAAIKDPTNKKAPIMANNMPSTNLNRRFTSFIARYYFEGSSESSLLCWQRVSATAIAIASFNSPSKNSVSSSTLFSNLFLATGKIWLVAIRCCKKVASSLFVSCASGLFHAALHRRIKLLSESGSNQGPTKSATDELSLLAGI